ncbi:glycosyltransferase family 2 protein [Patescibacteria group bacterium]|nr:glycosyltransferase family 2 protein [Patescibacteria group bacterium]MBU1563546.1 glycosyltransferase family 2 protein [Patescibacteria group bacterium]MBU2068481.1 glycosyltransferase family 2 protein [Patescibacteria group bacterium]
MDKKLSIIIPVLNEEATLEKILERVSQVPVLDYQKEIIVVNDGSTDQTGEILKKVKDKFNLIILKHKKNRGKGQALRTGFKVATGQVIVIQDADLEYDPNDFQKLCHVFEKTGSTVYGSRNLNPERRGYHHYVLGVWVLTLVNNLLFGSKLTDTYTCYKLFPASLIKNIPLESCGFEIEAEMTAKILKKGESINEVAISYNPRKFKEGKKIRFKDGLKGLWTIIKCRVKS